MTSISSSSLTSLTLSVSTGSPPNVVTYEQDIPLSSVNMGSNSILVTNQNLISAFNNQPAGTIFTPYIDSEYNFTGLGHNEVTKNIGSNYIPKKITPFLSLEHLSKTTTDTPFSLTPSVTKTGTGVLSFSISDTSVATISGDMLTVVGAGTTTITVSLAASLDGVYTAASTTASLDIINMTRLGIQDIVDNINTKGSLMYSYSISINSSNKIAIADTINKNVKLFNITGILKKTFIPKPNTNRFLSHLVSIFIDDNDNIYVADDVDNCVYIFYSNGNENIINTQYPAKSVVADNSGNIYVAIEANYILEYNSARNFVKQIQHADPGAGSSIMYLTIDGNGVIYYINNYSSSIYKYNTITDTSDTFTTHDSIVTFGITVDTNGYVYITVLSYGNVRIYNQDGSFNKTIANGQIVSPVGIAHDSENNIFVCSVGENLIKAFVPFQ